MSQIVYSLFPGVGLFDAAFRLEGFFVLRGPDLVLGEDIRGHSFEALRGHIDGVIGGPPCQSFSKAIAARGGGEAASHGNLIPEFERAVLEIRPRWWVMENVPQAPLPENIGCTWNEVFDAWAFGAAQYRKRRFSSNLELKLEEAPEQWRHADPWPTVTATEAKCSAGSNERVMRQRAGRKVGRRMTLEEVCGAFGLPPTFHKRLPAFRKEEVYRLIGNGIPLEMGLAISRAVKDAT